MFKNRFFQILVIAVLIVGAYLIVNAVGPKVGASSSAAAPVGFGELRLFEASQGAASGGSSSMSPQALDAWAARYAGLAAGLTSESALSQKALDAWAARYSGEAAASGVSSRAYSGTFSSGSIYGGGEWNPDAFYAGGGGR